MIKTIVPFWIYLYQLKKSVIKNILEYRIIEIIQYFTKFV